MNEKVTKASGSIHIPKAAASLALPEFANGLVRLAGKEENVPELNLVVVPATVALSAGRDGDSLNS